MNVKIREINVLFVFKTGDQTEKLVSSAISRLQNLKLVKVNATSLNVGKIHLKSYLMNNPEPDFLFITYEMLSGENAEIPTGTKLFLLDSFGSDYVNNYDFSVMASKIVSMVSDLALKTVLKGTCYIVDPVALNYETLTDVKYAALSKYNLSVCEVVDSLSDVKKIINKSINEKIAAKEDIIDALKNDIEILKSKII